MIRSLVRPICRDIARSIVNVWTPLDLFSYSVPGLWYDFSDLSTLYQDSTGVTPVTGVEQPLGLTLDKSEGLVLGPDLVSGVWANPGGVWAYEGEDLRCTATTNNYNTATLSAPLLTATWYLVEFEIKEFTSGLIRARIREGGTLAQSPHFGGVGVKRAILYNNSNTIFDLDPSFSLGFVGLIGSISVRELPGIHASQATSTARPKLSSRYNMLTHTETFDSSAAWNQTSFAVITGNQAESPIGGLTADLVTARNASYGGLVRCAALPTYAASTTYRLSCYAKAGTHSRIGLRPSGDCVVTTGDKFCHFDLSTGVATAITPKAGTVAAVGMTPLADGWYWCYVDYTTAGTVSANTTDLGLVQSDGATAWTPAGTETVYLWGASLVPANQSHLPYQRVGDSPFALASRTNDYDWDFAKFPPYLAPDLVDDKLTTTVPAITGQIALATTSGLWVDDITLSAGAFEMGVTTYTGGPAGLLSTLGAQVIGYVLKEGAFTAYELSALTQYYKTKGCPGLITMGAELVSNGTFDTDLTGWAALDVATAIWSAGAVAVDRNGSALGTGHLQQTMAESTVVGRYYIGAINVLAVSHGISFTAGGAISTVHTSVSRYRGIVMAATASAAFLLGARNSAAATFTADDVSLKEIIFP